MTQNEQSVEPPPSFPRRRKLRIHRLGHYILLTKRPYRLAVKNDVGLGSSEMQETLQIGTRWRQRIECYVQAVSVRSGPDSFSSDDFLK